MMAWANLESYNLMLSTGRTHFWSRSRQRLWMKGEESGHVQDIVSIQTDCDNDTLLIRVKQTGNACHLDRPSCFDEVLYGSLDGTDSIIPELRRIIRDRKEPSAGQLHQPAAVRRGQGVEEGGGGRRARHREEGRTGTARSGRPPT